MIIIYVITGFLLIFFRMFEEIHSRITKTENPKLFIVSVFGAIVGILLLGFVFWELVQLFPLI